MKHGFSTLIITLLLHFSMARVLMAAETVDITQISLEQLLETEFIPASRIARQISDAPSAVSIVTAQDIHDYGYKTLADILRSMRGLYVTSSLDYDYLGGRGFGSPGDYAGRIMLTIDGYVTNDNFYNQIFLGEDALLDVGMIDRVEFIPGPGSTTYGNSAFLGVINIVTKRGRDIDGAIVSVDYSNKHHRRKKLTYGKQFENGADIIFSASKYDDAGLSYKFDSLDNWEPWSGDPYTNQTLNSLKINKNERLFFKGSIDGWTLEFATVKRDLLSNSFIGFLEPSDLDYFSNNSDKNSFISLKYDADIGQQLKLSSHIYMGEYKYHFSNISHDDFWSASQDSIGRWWGSDFKFVGTWFDRHKLLFGAEYRNDYRQRIDEEYVNLLTLDSYPWRFDTRMETISFYLQDEFRVTDKLTLVPGVRSDYNSVSNSTISPRFAVIYQPISSSTFKLSYGNAFRYANPWERYIAADIDNEPESVSTIEFVWQQQFTDKTRLTTSLYRNQVKDAITSAYDELNTIGQELGIEHVSNTGFRINASIAHQIAEDNRNQWLINSPRWIGKLNIAQPLFDNRIMAGIELQTLGRRLDYNRDVHGTDTLVNLTLSSERLLANTDISLTIKNLLATDQSQILADQRLVELDDPQRSIWLKLEYTFQ